MAMWNVLGARDVDVCHWESFGMCLSKISIESRFVFRN